LETGTCEKVGYVLFDDEASQIYSKNRNLMADETLDDNLQLATTKTGTAKGTIVSDKPRLQAEPSPESLQ